MNTRFVRRAIKWTTGGFRLATLGYATTVGVGWLRYGHPAPARGDEADPLLDRFMPSFDVVDRRHARVAAPAEVTLCAATETDLESSAIIRGIFKARALILGATAGPVSQPHGLLAQVTAMGWGLLADVPGREIVMGAVTQPWEADVVFRAIPPEDFAAFREPGYVKIVWTLRADPDGPDACVFRTETRAATTDAVARSRFRRYWSRFSPGIALIRRIMVRSLKADAEARMRRVRA